MPHRLSEPVNAIARVPLFRGLQRSVIARIAKGARIIAASRGTVLFRRGDPCEGLNAVISGQVKLALQAGQAHEKVLELVGPGGTFGEAAMFLRQPHLVTAETLADSRLLHIASAVLFEELGRDTRFARRVIANLSRRLDRFTSELEALSTRTGTERVAEFLVRQLPAHRRANSCTTVLPAAKGVIASQLNLTHEHFSRLLHNLAAAGIISVAGRKIRILDIGRLRAHTS